MKTAQNAGASKTTPRLGDGGLRFFEYVMREPLPLATIHDAVLDFLNSRDDAVLYGAQAVNAYVRQHRDTDDVDISAQQGRSLAEELRAYLADRFRIAARVREVRGGIGYRIYQVRRDGNRHLVHVRPVSVLPPAQRIGGILVVTPPELIANKVVALRARRGRPKEGTDLRDLVLLLLQFPDLKTTHGAVRDRLVANGAEPDSLAEWDALVARQILPEDEDAEFE